MRARVRWLGTWWFLGSVGVLLLNDHVLKARSGAWWTGKLSDLAGLAAVAVLAAVVVGRRPGLVLAGAAWVALKLVPGVAELVAPVLGGTTRRDPTDLVALVVLLPLWWGLAEGQVLDAQHARHRSGPDARRRRRAGLAAVLPVVGACGAVLATTAIACGGDPAVVRVIDQGAVVWAQVERDYAARDPADADWSSSADGGRSWDGGTPPSEVVAIARAEAGVRPDGTSPTTRPGDPAPGSAEAEPSCAGGACYRIVDRRRIERRVVGSDAWEAELGLDDDEYVDISTGCSDPQKGVLASVAGIEGGGGGRAVAALGADGVAVRDDDGTWDTVRVVDRPPDRLEQLLLIGSIGVVVFVVGLVVLVVVLVVRSRRRRPPSPPPGVGPPGWAPAPGWLPPPPDPG